MKMMKMNEKKSKSRRPRYRLCGDPKVSVVFQALCLAWNEPKLAGPAQKGFSDPHPMEMTHLPSEDTENVVWTTVCKKNKKQKKLNFIKTELFSFQIVNLSINVTHVVV